MEERRQNEEIDSAEFRKQKLNQDFHGLKIKDEKIENKRASVIM